MKRVTNRQNRAATFTGHCGVAQHVGLWGVAPSWEFCKPVKSWTWAVAFVVQMLWHQALCSRCMGKLLACCGWGRQPSTGWGSPLGQPPCQGHFMFPTTSFRLIGSDVTTNPSIGWTSRVWPHAPGLGLWRAQAPRFISLEKRSLDRISFLIGSHIPPNYIVSPLKI